MKAHLRPWLAWAVVGCLGGVGLSVVRGGEAAAGEPGIIEQIWEEGKGAAYEQGLDQTATTIKENLAARIAERLSAPEARRASAVTDRIAAVNEIRQTKIELTNQTRLLYDQGRKEGRSALDSFNRARDGTRPLREKILQVDQASRARVATATGEVKAAESSLTPDRAKAQQSLGVLDKVKGVLKAMDIVGSLATVLGEAQHAYEGGSWANVSLTIQDDFAKKCVTGDAAAAGAFTGGAAGSLVGPGGTVAGSVGGAFVGGAVAGLAYEAKMRPVIENAKASNAYQAARARYMRSDAEIAQVRADRQLAKAEQLRLAALFAEQEKVRQTKMKVQAERERAARLQAAEMRRATIARENAVDLAAWIQKRDAQARKESLANPFSVRQTPTAATAATGEELAIDLTVDGGLPPFQISGAITGAFERRAAQYTWKAPAQPGEHVVAITVTDATGRTAQHTARITVGAVANPPAQAARGPARPAEDKRAELRKATKVQFTLELHGVVFAVEKKEKPKAPAAKGKYANVEKGADDGPSLAMDFESGEQIETINVTVPITWTGDNFSGSFKKQEGDGSSALTVSGAVTTDGTRIAHVTFGSMESGEGSGKKTTGAKRIAAADLPLEWGRHFESPGLKSAVWSTIRSDTLSAHVRTVECAQARTDPETAAVETRKASSVNWSAAQAKENTLTVMFSFQ